MERKLHQSNNRNGNGNGDNGNGYPKHNMNTRFPLDLSHTSPPNFKRRHHHSPEKRMPANKEYGNGRAPLFSNRDIFTETRQKEVSQLLETQGPEGYIEKLKNEVMGENTPLRMHAITTLSEIGKRSEKEFLKIVLKTLKAETRDYIGTEDYAIGIRNRVISKLENSISEMERRGL